MGTTQAKVAEHAKEVIVENSSGFHMFELHLPTMGFGFVTFAAICVVMCCLWILARRFLHCLMPQINHQPAQQPQPYAGQFGYHPAMMGPPPMMPHVSQYWPPQVPPVSYHQMSDFSQASRPVNQFSDHQTSRFDRISDVATPEIPEPKGPDGCPA